MSASSRALSRALSQSSSFDLLALPTELKRRTATFLATVDVLRLRETCASLRQALVLRRLEPVREWRGNPPEDPNRPPPLLQRCPHSLFVWNPSRVHSLTLTVSYQRADNILPYACFLFLCAYPRHELPPSVVDYGGEEGRGAAAVRLLGGRLVAQLHSPTAPPPDEVIVWRTTWTPTNADDDQVYYLWCGGRHRMQIHNIRLTTRLLDDPTGAVTEQYRHLARLGVLSHGTAADVSSSQPAAVAAPTAAHTFYPNLLLHVARSLRQPPRAARPADELEADIPTALTRHPQNSLHTFWSNEAGLAMDATALAAMEEVLQADLDERQWRAQEAAHRQEQEDALLESAAPSWQAWRFLDAQELFAVRERESVFLVTDLM